MTPGRKHITAQHRSALPGVVALTLVTDHAFPRHSHDGFGIAVNPGEMHDGAPIGGARGWRMLYLDPALVIRELVDEGEDQLEIARPALRDPVLVSLFARLFAQVTAAVPEPLAPEEDLLRTLARLLRRHGTRSRPMSRAAPAVAMAWRRLDEAPPSRPHRPCGARGRGLPDLRPRRGHGGGGSDRAQALRVDGGMSANDWFCQFLADILDVPVQRPAMLESTALGAAVLAGLATGLFASLEDSSARRLPGSSFTPAMPAARRDALVAGWHAAVRLALAPGNT